MNHFEDLQRAILTEWDAATAITPEKVYFSEAPANATIPYAVFFLDSVGSFTFAGDMQEFRVQFNLFQNQGDTSEPINDFAEEVRTKFNRKKITMAGGHTMVSPLLIETETIFKNDTKHWQDTMVFDCRIK